VEKLSRQKENMETMMERICRKSCLVSRCLSCTSGANVDTQIRILSLYLLHTVGLGDKLLCLFYWQTDKQTERRSRNKVAKSMAQHGRKSEYASNMHPSTSTHRSDLWNMWVALAWIGFHISLAIDTPQHTPWQFYVRSVSLFAALRLGLSGGDRGLGSGLGMMSGIGD